MPSSRRCPQSRSRRVPGGRCVRESRYGDRLAGARSTRGPHARGGDRGDRRSRVRYAGASACAPGGLCTRYGTPGDRRAAARTSLRADDAGHARAGGGARPRPRANGHGLAATGAYRAIAHRANHRTIAHRASHRAIAHRASHRAIAGRGIAATGGHRAIAGRGIAATGARRASHRCIALAGAEARTGPSRRRRCTPPGFGLRHGAADGTRAEPHLRSRGRSSADATGDVDLELSPDQRCASSARADRRAPARSAGRSGQRGARTGRSGRYAPGAGEPSSCGGALRSRAEVCDRCAATHRGDRAYRSPRAHRARRTDGRGATAERTATAQSLRPGGARRHQRGRGDPQEAVTTAVADSSPLLDCDRRVAPGAGWHTRQGRPRVNCDVARWHEGCSRRPGCEPFA